MYMYTKHKKESETTSMLSNEQHRAYALRAPPEPVRPTQREGSTGYPGHGGLSDTVQFSLYVPSTLVEFQISVFKPHDTSVG